MKKAPVLHLVRAASLAAAALCVMPGTTLVVLSATAPEPGGSRATVLMPQQRTDDRPVFANLVYSINKGAGLSPADWQIVTKYGDLVFGLDGHGYEFPGYLDDFRVAKPETPLYAFMTTMAIQRDDVKDQRFKTLDRHEDVFLHLSDPASLKVVAVGNKTLLFWIRDFRRQSSKGYARPLGVSAYIVESAPTSEGPWATVGQPIPENGTSSYRADVPTSEKSWFRLKSKLKDGDEVVPFSWPTQSDPAPSGFAYLQSGPGLEFRAGMWGSGPDQPKDVVLEWGNQGRWGYPNPASSRRASTDGITEYVGTVTSRPARGAWVLRLRDSKGKATSMSFDVARRNNRIIDRYGGHVFKPDHPRAISMFRKRLSEAQELRLTGARLDFALDSYPSWYVAALPAGEDAAYSEIKPKVLSMLKQLKLSHPSLKLWLNGISVTTTVEGITDYLGVADGADLEFIGWSTPNESTPFRDSEMIDGVIGIAHKKGKPVTCYSYADAANAEARTTSFARYWLVYAKNVYYQFMTSDNHQSVDYFPEFDLDMGDPELKKLGSRADLISERIYRRNFAKGIALYNPTAGPVKVDLGGTFFEVRLTGGHADKQGGDGKLHFEGPQSTLTLPPKRGAIVVRKPALGRSSKMRPVTIGG